jgi:hypothetical protein
MLKQLDVLIGFVVVMSVVSLLITVTTQMVSSLLALRGKNQRDALKALFLGIAGSRSNAVREGAEDLAKLVLKRPTISDSALSVKGSAFDSWKLATAIRPDECLAAINKIAGTKTDQLEQSMGAESDAEKGSILSAKNAAIAMLRALTSPEAKQEALNAIATAKQAVPAAANALGQIEDKVKALASLSQEELQSWTKRFQSVQDRAEQWFTMHARRVTVCAAFVLAFGLQLDSFQLLNRLSTDSDLRNGLLNVSSAVQKRADETLNTKFPGTVYTSALKQLKTEDAAAKAFADPPVIENHAQAVDWLRQQSQEHSLDVDAQKALMQRLDNLVQAQSKQRINAAKEEFGSITDLYGQAKVQLIPQPYPVGRHWWGLSNKNLFSSSLWLPNTHFFGLIATAALLTLGSPFWFNLLGNLASLRSTVAAKIQKDQESAATQK